MRNMILCVILGPLMAGFHPHGATVATAGGLDFTRLGGWTEGYCGAMEVEGTTVHLANGAWLEAVEVSDPAAPRVRSRVELSAGIMDLEHTRGRICALTTDGVLHVVRDRGDRGLQVEGRVGIKPSRDALIRGMTVVGPYVYVNDGRHLHVVDIPESRPPRVIKSLDSTFAPCVMRSAEATGNTLYVGNESTTLIFDVSEPLQPVLVRDLDVTGEPLMINDGLLNTSQGWNYSFLWDIADPRAPRALQGELGWDHGWMPGFAVHDTLIYATAWGKVAAYTRAGRLLSRGVTPTWNMEQLASQGDHLLARQEGLTILGLADPLAPAVVGRHRTGLATRDLQIVGDRAYLNGGAGQLTVLDVSDPDRPVLLGAWLAMDEQRYPMEGVVSVNGGRALVGGGGYNDRILDVTDPTAPRPLTSPGSFVVAPSYGKPWAIPAGDGWFVSGWTSPQRLSIAADGSRVLKPVDLPEFPCEVRPGVYVGRRNRGDITPGVWMVEDGGDPQRVADLVARVDAQPLGRIFAVSGDIVYGLDLRFHIVHPDSFPYVVHRVVAAFDFSEPREPRLLGVSELPLEVGSNSGLAAFSRVVADAGLLYVWNASIGEVVVLDARDPGHVVRCGGLWVGNGIVDVEIAQDRLVVTTESGGFQTYERPVLPARGVAAAPGAARGLALGAAPNPFNPATRVTFHLPLAGPAEVDVFDLGGRRVRRLHAGFLAAGDHVFTWRGTDDAGRDVAAGTYLARARGGGQVVNAKLLLVK